MTDIKQYEPLWGSWYVDMLIGEGSFGKVYRIRREEFGKTYYSAVKIISIPQSEADLRQMRSEGMDEASALSFLHAFVTDIIMEIDLMSAFRGNSNIVSFEDHKVLEKQNEIGWDILIRMELLTSLSDHVTNKHLSREEIIKLGIHICRALELCALKNTIHRDIKPDNIFVSEYGEYKLGDFGIARQIERTMSGLSKKGTYTYMAPEVFRGYDYGASVDMYSLGIVMYRFLNQNRTPFLPDFPSPITPRDRDEALQRRMNGAALPPIAGIDAALSEVVLRACAFDRRERFANATEMREALEQVTGGGSYAPVATTAVPAVSAVPAERVEVESEQEHTEGLFDSQPPGEELEQTDRVEPEPTSPRQRQGQARARNRRTSLAVVLLVVVVLSIIAVLVVSSLPDASVNEVAGVDEIQYDGEYIVFGNYLGEPLKWQVLAEEEGRVLIITKDCVALQPYHNDWQTIAWEGSSLRAWLNGGFYTEAFSAEEQSRIQETLIVNSDSAAYGIEGGNDTTDKLFLLSLDEAVQYFTSSAARTAEFENKPAWWWLRSPGIDSNYAANIFTYGNVYDIGIGVNDQDCAVRPALWIKAPHPASS